ncbi:uncharacterized protein LOC116853491 [Odontomachus brunneus]|uniref:uncharacterized protein LOC116853491 n=1 Tax=Odontomachus brunneus TaxID=486640 RepID=UPI0013F26843|nr:uncharacterized protein LOC116853491 [Odontomachus brunneus]
MREMISITHPMDTLMVNAPTARLISENGDSISPEGSRPTTSANGSNSKMESMFTRMMSALTTCIQNQQQFVEQQKVAMHQQQQVLAKIASAVNGNITGVVVSPDQGESTSGSSGGVDAGLCQQTMPAQAAPVILPNTMAVPSANILSWCHLRFQSSEKKKMKCRQGAVAAIEPAALLESDGSEKKLEHNRIYCPSYDP